MQVPQSYRKIWRDQLGEKVLSVRVHVRRVLDAAFGDVFVDVHWGATVPERSETAEHFEYEDAKGPPFFFSKVG